MWRQTTPLAALSAVVAACARSPADPPSAASASSARAPHALEHHVVRFSDLPPPYETRSADNPPVVVARPEGARLELPAGFHIAPYAEGGFDRPRWLAVAPNDDVFVADSGAGSIVVLRGLDADGRAAQRFTFARGLTLPFGIAFAPGFVYVGDTDAIVRFAYEPGDVQARAPAQTIAPLPGTGYHEHWTRNLLFAKDFKKLYVSVGSRTNDDAEGNPERGAVLQMNPDGTERRIFVSGTRNPIGMAWRPGTDELWAVVQERDGLGDDLAPDYLARLTGGGFYGWPFAYAGPHVDPRHQGERPDLVAATREPDLLVQAHVALMDLVFYEGSMFPPDWRGDIIVSEHGSWNRSLRVGYGLARVRMQGGRPVEGYDDFVTGWALAPDRKEVWGRPVGLAVLADGSVLVVDDGALMVWRIT